MCAKIKLARVFLLTFYSVSSHVRTFCRAVLMRETGHVHFSVCFVVLVTLHSVSGCASTGGKCASNPCPAGYKCTDFSQGFQCKCVDSSKCVLEEAGCEDRLCITGM